MLSAAVSGEIETEAGASFVFLNADQTWYSACSIFCGLFAEQLSIVMAHYVWRRVQLMNVHCFAPFHIILIRMIEESQAFLTLII